MNEVNAGKNDNTMMMMIMTSVTIGSLILIASLLHFTPILFSLPFSPLISPLLSSPLSSPLFFSILFSFLLSSSLLSSFYFCLSATQSLIPLPFGPIHSLDSEAHTPTNTQALPPFYPCPKSRKKDKKILYGRR